MLVLVCGVSPGVNDMIFLSAFSTVLIFFKVLRPMLVNGASQQVGGLNQCCGVWLPICEAWILLHRGMARHTSSSCFIFFFLLTTPENENMAFAVHISISIPTSLHLIACFGSLWWDILVSFKFIFLLFADLGGLPGLP